MQNSLVIVLQKLFNRDLLKLRKEINAYQEESNLWIVEKSIANSAGNLCLHLLGNLNWFIGAQIGNTGYIRQRDREFGDKDVPRAELIKWIDQTLFDIDSSLDKLTAEQLQADFPLNVFGEKTSTEYMMVHLATHFSYHLGQINYHRRLLDA
jgi:uncharacterized damage-inducible protein DinB